MDLSNVWNTYIVGSFINVAAGIGTFFLIRKLFEWLPTSAELHERFRAVRQERQAHAKIVALTPLLFISFYWLFVANLLWVGLTILIEILNWPDIAATMAQRNSPRLSDQINEWLPGLILGRSLLYIFFAGWVALCFYRGLAIARQCWDVYRAMPNEA